MRQTFILDRSAFDARRSATPVVENAKNGVVRPLLEITKHGYGDEASDTTSYATPILAPPCEGFFLIAMVYNLLADRVAPEHLYSGRIPQTLQPETLLRGEI